MEPLPAYLKDEHIRAFIKRALQEDIGPGDYSTLAAIDENVYAEARLIIKEEGILAGLEVATRIFNEVDNSLKVKLLTKEGERVKVGEIALEVSGIARSILSAERLVLNILQRMSGIATTTNKMVQLIAGTKAKLLDTRKTTPNFRAFEKWAVKIGGGNNHRFALYDMIMLKDNHNDYAGGIKNAIARTKAYLQTNNLDLKIEVETRNLVEVRQAAEAGIDIILLDNMSTDEIREAVKLIAGRAKTEASGSINESNITEFAGTGVDFISVGALTHSYKSLDMSLKARLTN